MRIIATVSLATAMLLTSSSSAIAELGGSRPQVVISESAVQLSTLAIDELASREDYRRALRLAGNSQVEEAIELLEGRAKDAQGPEKGFLLYRLGFLNIKRGEYQRAHYYFASVGTSPFFAPEDCIVDSRMRLGYLEVRSKNYIQALEYFQDVAAGRVRATSLQATDAAMRSAFVLRALQRPGDAVAVLKSVYARSPEKDDRDYALLLAAATLWESGKGDYNPTIQLNERRALLHESIQLAAKLVEDESVRPEIRCVAELIHFENFYFLGDYKTAIPLAETFVGKWGAEIDRSYKSVTQGKTWAIEEFPRRHVLTAETWLMIMYYRTQDFESALKLAREIGSGSWRPEDPYRNFNVFGYAKIHEQLALERIGRSVEAGAAANYGEEKWTGWYSEALERMRREADPIGDAGFGASIDQLQKNN